MHCPLKIAATGVMLGIILGSCATSSPPSKAADPCGYDVRISVTNKDITAPDAVFDILVDGVPVIHGPVQPSPGGEYLFFTTRLPRRNVMVAAKSTGGGRAVAAQKEVTTVKVAWIVITRLKNMDDEPEMVIEFSYENPWE